MVEYQSLSKFITNGSDELKHQLEGLTLPSDGEKIKRLCSDFVTEITKDGSLYMNQFSDLEQDLLSPVLKIVNTLYCSDIELEQNVAKSISSQNKWHQTNVRQSKANSFSTKEFGGALISTITGTTIATICKPSAGGWILMAAAISSVIGMVLRNIWIEKEAVIGEFSEPNHEPIEYKLMPNDINRIIERLVSVGESIDKVLLLYRRHIEICRNEHSHSIESFNLEKKYKGILECFQSVLCNVTSMESTPLVKDTIKQINNSLNGYGFKIVHYSEDVKNLFEVKYDVCVETEEFKPAIIKMIEGKETLVLKGVVVVPEK